MDSKETTYVENNENDIVIFTKHNATGNTVDGVVPKDNIKNLIETLQILSNSGTAVVGQGVSQPVQTAGSCTWEKKEEDTSCYYETGCGCAFDIDEENYTHEHFTYCPYCGAAIKDLP